MRLLRHFVFVLFLFLIYDAESAQLQKTVKTTRDLQHEEGAPSHPSSSLALSSLFYKWANVYESPSEIGEVIQQLNITDNCKAHTMEFLFRLTSQEYVKQSPWVMQMIDSWGKFPEGILQGHVNAFGDYDECVGVDVSDLQFLGVYDNSLKYSTKFRGLYCNVGLQVPVIHENGQDLNENNGEDLAKILLDNYPIRSQLKISPSFGVCFPSSCSTADVNTIVGYITPKIDPSANAMVFGECLTQSSSDFDTGFWAMIGVLILLLGVTAIGTALDLIQNMQKREMAGSKHILMRVLQSFSVIRNTKKLLETESKGEENFGCVHGIKFLTMLWIILSHTWSMLEYFPPWNVVETKITVTKFYLSPFINGTSALNTFFTVTGLLTCYSLLKAYEKTKGGVSLLQFYFHRFVRLTPAYAVLVGVVATILPHLSSGPFWFIMEKEGEKCRANWWSSLLYFNNFFRTDQMCVYFGWYLSVDMQLYIVAPFLIYPFWRYRRAGAVLLSIVTVIAVLTPGLQAHLQHLPPTSIASRDDKPIWSDVYIKPWTYLQSYIVGTWLGCFIFKNSGKEGVDLSRLQVATGWLLSTSVALTVLYGINSWFDPKSDIPKTTGFLYASLHRFAWGICICWVIYACSQGHGGFINRFLSWKLFVPFGRVTYCTYLVSFCVLLTYALSKRQATYCSFYTVMYTVFGNMVMCVSVGFVWTVLFESPFIQLEKLLRTGK